MQNEPQPQVPAATDLTADLPVAGQRAVASEQTGTSNLAAGTSSDPNAATLQNEPVHSDNLTIDGVSALAAVIIAAFAVDRFATGVTSFLTLFPAYRNCCSASSDWSAAATSSEDDATGTSRSTSPSERNIAALRGRMVYFLFAAIAAGGVVWIGQIGILDALGFKEALSTETHQYFDFLLTALILTAGADRVSALLQLSGASVGGTSDPKPIEITGTLMLDGRKEEFKAKIAEAGSDSE